MVKLVDEKGHKDQEYDEKKPWRPSRQNRGSLPPRFSYHEQKGQDPRFSYHEQSGSQKGQEDSIRFGNRGNMPVTDGRTRNFHGNNQADYSALGTDRRQSSEAYVVSRKGDARTHGTGGRAVNFQGTNQVGRTEGSSGTSGRTSNWHGSNLADQSALGTDRKQSSEAYGLSRTGGRAVNFYDTNQLIDRTHGSKAYHVSRRGEERCQERPFQGTSLTMQHKDRNPVLRNQLGIINRILTSAAQDIIKNKDVSLVNQRGHDAIIKKKRGHDAPSSDKLRDAKLKHNVSGMVQFAHERKDKITDQVNVSQGHAVTPSNKIQNITASDYLDTPVKKIENTSIAAANQEVNLSASESKMTPVQNNSSPEGPSDGDSSVSTTRDRSCTPTLSELENSVHYDCRIDKILPVALDYAVPKKIA